MLVTWRINRNSNLLHQGNDCHSNKVDFFRALLGQRGHHGYISSCRCVHLSDKRPQNESGQWCLVAVTSPLCLRCSRYIILLDRHLCWEEIKLRWINRQKLVLRGIFLRLKQLFFKTLTRRFERYYWGTNWKFLWRFNCHAKSTILGWNYTAWRRAIKLPKTSRSKNILTSEKSPI